MLKYCRDQARDELWLMMGGGAAVGVAGGVPLIGALTFNAGLTAVQAAVVTRIAQVYNVDLIAAAGAGGISGAITAMGGGQTPLSQFVEDLLSRRIRFCDHYQLKKTQNAKIVFFPTECWKCKKQSYIYYLENPYYTCCGEEVEDYCCEIPRRFRPEVIAAVRSFLKTDAAKKIRMGEIKTRYSKTVEDSYISFGCSWCNALFGDFYYFGEVNNAIYGDDGSTHTVWETQLTVTESNILDYETHWCYPENEDFCI